jgi:hypothetical protein
LYFDFVFSPKMYLFMKKGMRNLLLIAAMFIASTDVKGQADFKNSVKVTPLAFLKGQIAVLHYERAVNPNITVGIGVAPIFFPPVLGAILYPIDQFNNGIAIDPEIRYYAKSDKVMDGFFFGAYSSNRFSSWESSGTLSSGFNTDPLNLSFRRSIFGVQAGTQKLLGEHFCIDFYGGMGVSFSQYKAYSAFTNKLLEVQDASGLNLRLNVSIGYQF